MLDVNGLEIYEGCAGQLLCEVLSVDPEEGVRVRILNSEMELLIGFKNDEALGGLVADSEFAVLDLPKAQKAAPDGEPVADGPAPSA